MLQHIFAAFSRTDIVLRMDGTNPPNRAAMTLWSFNKKEDLEKYSIGVDSDIGGTSTARLDFVPNPNDPNGKGTARFWGDMRLGVRSDLRGKIRGGYAGFRSKVTIPESIHGPTYTLLHV